MLASSAHREQNGGDCGVIAGSRSTGIGAILGRPFAQPRNPPAHGRGHRW